MRVKFTTAIVVISLCFSLFAQDAKTRAEFFKEFYGTLINSSDIEIPEYKKEVVPTVDLSDVIKQLESRYDIDIPAEEEAKFTTVEEVAEYVNLYLQKQNQSFETVDTPAEKPIEKPVKPGKTKKESYSWKYMIYGSYGLTEPLGVTGNLGWNGNLGGAGAFDLSSNMYTWEAGIMLHPYGWNGKERKKANSFGVSFDYASFDYTGVHDTSLANYNANDTTATRYAVSVVFRQNLLGRKKDRPKFSVYFEESIRLGVHSYGFVNSDLNWNNHLSMGVGLAQGINFLIFDLKLYEVLAYSPDIVSVTGFSIINSLDYEVGLRLGIALKF
jgi:hypothetical protein